MWLIKNFIVILYSLLIAILSILIFPFDSRNRLSNPLMKIWTKAVLFIYGIKVNVYGQENIDAGKGKIYISNHASYLDIFVQLAYLPDNVRMIYKKEINKVPLLGWAMMCAGFVALDRDRVRDAMKSLDKAAERVRNGLSVVIYPEGTRTSDGNVGEFKRGMFFLADKSKADIIPVSLSGTFKLMPGGSSKVKPGTVDMVIDKPVKYRKDKELLNEIRDIVIKNIKP
ncbi:MAG: 1-acyl-sn-glycerol-3-phosphate acyltransferase [Chlorobi bacterium OLB5]|nr:MAG: 1-acyl-sn-glycerol-3-phosphate acyltransferase [Chlorobi bacterium OLB5]